MAPESTDPQDPVEERATAFVFGELDREQATEFMKQMASSSELQSVVASIRKAVASLQSELSSDTPGVSESDRRRIEIAMLDSNPAPPTVVALATEASSRAWVIGLAVAATLLLATGLTLPALNKVITASNDTQGLRDRIRQIELENERLNDKNQAIQAELASVISTHANLLPNDNTLIPTEDAKHEKSRSANEGQKVASKDASLDNPLGNPTDQSNGQTGDPSDSSKKRGNSAPLQGMNQLASDGKSADSPQSGQGDPESELLNSEGFDVTEALADRSNKIALPVNAESDELEGMDALKDMDMDMGMGMGMGMDMGEDMTMMMGVGSFRDSARGLPSGDRFDPIRDNSYLPVAQSPLSTFSIDVDTAAYSKIRMYLMQHNRLPNPDAVRIEELINYFSYDYEPPKDDRPFAASMEVAGCPWNPSHRLARVGIKGKVIEEQRSASNLVFLLDVSGSMNRPNKLPLVIDGMKMLVNQLGENDSVAIVVYAGAAGMVLDSTAGDRKKRIIDSLDRLRAGGSTNGGQGIQLAYQIARDNFIDGGINRVILCSDGDFNVGVTGTDQLVDLAAENAAGDIFLSVLGFGVGNHNDSMMEKISNRGNGNYAFIDNEDEARKVLVDQMEGTLVTIAKDVKIQIEFNPMEVESYRLIGYENRILADKDFKDDTKDAGEIGAGHTVTALYEFVPKRDLVKKDQDGSKKPIDELKYQRKIQFSEEAQHFSEEALSGELLTLKIRYKDPTGGRSTLIEFPITDGGKRFNQTDRDFQFAASVAAFGMLLRNSPYKGNANYQMVQEIATAGAKDDRTGYRDEFLSLVKKAALLAQH